MAFVTHLRRVAIVGLPNSGKTVLLTSLLMHLKNLSPALSDGLGKLTSFRPRHRDGVVGRGLPEFPFDQYRRHLAENGVFPDKTVSESAFSFDLEIGNGLWNGKHFQVELLDVPGDRFYDVEMFGKKYAEWCDEIERLWQREPHPEMQAYLRLIASDLSPDAEHIVDAYRNLLSNLVADYRTSITPSTFRLSRSGVPVRGRSGAEILESAASNPCGLTLDSQFAPLFRGVRERHKALTDAFSRNYDDYQREVVEPLFSELARCDRMAILIDVPHLLAAANGAFEDQDHLIERALEALIPRPGVVRSIGRFIGDCALEVAATPRLFWESFQKLRPGRIEKVAFVATKSDLVAFSDNDRLSHLLSTLVEPKNSFLGGIAAEKISLSAVKSTENPGVKDGEMGHLTGRLQFDYNTKPPTRRSPNDAKVDYQVSRLPDEWPQSWEPNTYSFPPVFPDIPKYRIVCPKQENLDKLFKFIID